ncbi:hypothetical protein GCM10017788_28860 [Amycolatopsis acidiphila]|nr:hypothetical protein GCM10017788_28860 [Amycolatopsis acidiphila]
MVYRKLEGDHLYTGWDDAPRFSIENRAAGNSTDITVEYVSSVGGAQITKIRFPDVIEYRWVDSDWDRVWPHGEDHEFWLIEILESEFVSRVIDSSPYKRNAAVGHRLGNLPETDVHHYRLDFDNHGTYDVVSLECEVSVIRKLVT